LIRRGLSLAAAFLVTSLSKGLVFAEVVPLELARRTTRLAGMFRSHPASPGPNSAPAETSIESKISTRAESSVGIRHNRPKFARLFGLVLFSLVSFSMSVGICLAVFKPGGSDFDVREVLSALISGRAFSSDGTSCH